jgi:hypothetical protein
MEARIGFSDQFQHYKLSRDPVAIEVVLEALKDFTAASHVVHIGDFPFAHRLMITRNQILNQLMRKMRIESEFAMAAMVFENILPGPRGFYWSYLYCATQGNQFQAAAAVIAFRERRIADGSQKGSLLLAPSMFSIHATAFSSLVL